MIQILRLQQFAPLVFKMARNFGVLKFPLPDLGEKIKEGRVKKLYVREGDRVAQFDKIADVQSDKQFTEITAPEEGIIKKLHYNEDQTCQVGHVFLEIQTNSTHSRPSPIKHQETSKTINVEPPKQILSDKNQVLASATVKMWAREHKINLEQVTGTGMKGRVLKGDIINYLENRKSQPIKAKILKEEVKPSLSVATKTAMTQSQQLIQKLASYSSSVPQLFLHESFDVTELMQIRDSSLSKHHKLSLLSLLVKCFSLALNIYPKVNSVYSLNNQFGFNRSADQNILLPKYSEKGLSFSVIEKAQNLSTNHIQKSIQSAGSQEISSQAVKKLISNSSICLSNIGELGGISLNPLILGEMVCHVSIGQIRSQPSFTKNGKHEKRQFVTIVMGADHRVLDGATCARFTSTWKQLSENPKIAFLQMI